MDIRKRNNISISGSGQDILLFANGFGVDQKLWRHVFPVFHKDFQTVLFDYVGTGESDMKAYKPERYATLNGYVADILEICQSLKFQNVTYVGHSVSGMLGMLASLQKPQLFKQLIMVGPSPCYIDGPGYKGGLTREAVDGILQAIDSNFAGWAQNMAPVLMGNPDRPALGSELTQTFLRMDPKVASSFARNVFLSDYRQQLGQCKTPVAILQCSEDPVAPVEVGHYLHKQIKNSELVLLKAKGHYPSLSAPDELIHVIQSFAHTEKRRKAG